MAPWTLAKPIAAPAALAGLLVLLALLVPDRGLPLDRRGNRIALQTWLS